MPKLPTRRGFPGDRPGRDAPFVPADPATLAQIVGAYAVATGGRVVVTDATGRLLVDSNPTPGTQPDRSFASRPEFARALAGREADGTRHSDTLGIDLLYVAVPVVSGGEVIGVTGEDAIEVPLG